MLDYEVNSAQFRFPTELMKKQNQSHVFIRDGSEEHNFTLFLVHSHPWDLFFYTVLQISFKGIMQQSLCIASHVAEETIPQKKRTELIRKHSMLLYQIPAFKFLHRTVILPTAFWRCLGASQGRGPPDPLGQRGTLFQKQKWDC